MFQSDIDPQEIEVTAVELSPNALALWNKLQEIAVNPTTHMMRHTVIHELVDHVSERMAKKKRNSLKYVYSDIQRRCRKTDPPIPANEVRAIINAARAAGLLLHPNGNPIRSENAQFIIKHDAEALLIQLREYYIQQLLNTGETLSDPQALSELLWGDTQHEQEANEIVLWLKFEDGDIQLPAEMTKDIPIEQEQTETTQPSEDKPKAPEPEENTKAESAEAAEKEVPKTIKKSSRKRTTKKSAEQKTSKEKSSSPKKKSTRASPIRRRKKPTQTTKLQSDESNE